MLPNWKTTEALEARRRPDGGSRSEAKARELAKA